MILKRLVIENYGPFSSRTTLEVDDKVTILTGANDVGKSSILRLIQQICEGKVITEDEVNTYRRYEANTPWSEDERVRCIATFITTENPNMYLAASTVGQNVEIDI
jgi:predicted ATP-dependent endonuclease of OLD family